MTSNFNVWTVYTRALYSNFNVWTTPNDSSLYDYILLWGLQH